MRELENELCTMQLGSLHEDWLTGYPGLCCVTGGDATLPSRGLSLREAAERVWLTPGDEGGAECRLSPEMGQSLLSFLTSASSKKRDCIFLYPQGSWK